MATSASSSSTSMGDPISITGNCTLVTSEGEKVTVEKSVAVMSVLVKEMLSDVDDEDDNEIPLPNVKKDILNLVLEFCRHHSNDPMPEIEKPLKSSNMSEVVSEWDAKFIDVEQSVLFEIILASNFMDIKSLLDLACAKVASMIKGKTPEEIRQTFGIVNDFTPEEEAQVREENKWCEES